MAYTFDRLNEMLDEAGQGKINIFADQPNAGPSGNEVAGGGDKVQKGSAGTDVSSGGGGGGLGSGERAAPQQVSAATTQKALFDKNVPLQKAPKVVRQIGENLKSTDAALQDEANQYMAGAQQVDTDLSQDDIGKAAGGDQEAMGKVSSRLRATPKEYQAFAPKTDVYAQDRNIEDLKTEAGLKSLFQRESGPRYTAGEQAFDTALLMANPEFARVRGALMEAQGGLKQKAADLSKSKTAEARGLVTKEFEDATQAARSALTRLGEEVIAGNKSEAQAEADVRRALNKGQISKEEASKLIGNVKNLLSVNQPYTTEGRAIRYLDEVTPGVNPEQYLNVNETPGYEAFIDQGEADRFNRILGLLGANELGGRGGMLAGSGAGSQYGFNRGQYEKDLAAAALAKSQSVDQPKISKREELEKVARVRADEFNQAAKAARADPTNQAKWHSMMGQELMKMAPINYRPGEFMDAMEQANVWQYITPQEKDYRMMLNPDEMNLFNQLSQDLETAGFGTGKYKPAGEELAPGVYFDRDRFNSDLKDVFSRLPTTPSMTSIHTPANPGSLIIGEMPTDKPLPPPDVGELGSINNVTKQLSSVLPEWMRKGIDANNPNAFDAAIKNLEGTAKAPIGAMSPGDIKSRRDELSRTLQELDRIGAADRGAGAPSMEEFIGDTGRVTLPRGGKESLERLRHHIQDAWNYLHSPEAEAKLREGGVAAEAGRPTQTQVPPGEKQPGSKELIKDLSNPHPLDKGKNPASVIENLVGAGQEFAEKLPTPPVIEMPRLPTVELPTINLPPPPSFPNITKSLKKPKW